MNSEPHPFADLASFQTALLEVLHEGGGPADMRARVMERVADPELREYVRGFDERMLAVASELVRKWGRRQLGVPPR